MNLKTILVGLDGSARAPDVLSYAASLASIARAKLLICRAFAIPPDMTLAWPASDAALEASLHDQVLKYLEASAAGLPSELLGGVRVLLGVPWQALCTAAVVENADLIVVGSHGYGGIDRFLGTTAARVVNHADRPVLVVHERGSRGK